MTDLKEATHLAIHSTEAIQRWSQKILERIESRLKQDPERDISIDYPNYPPGASPLSFPNWAGRFVGPKGTNWGSSEEPPKRAGFFMISFRHKPQNKWHPTILWGVMQNVERRSGKSDVRTIYKQLLEVIHEKRGESKEIVQYKHAAGSWKLERRDFFKTLDGDGIEQLAEDVAKL